MFDEEQLEVLLETTSTGCYLESLIRSRRLCLDSLDLTAKIDRIINIELEIALMGAKKLLREMIHPADNIRVIK